jgi:hypothetical protein
MSEIGSHLSTLRAASPATAQFVGVEKLRKDIERIHSRPQDIQQDFWAYAAEQVQLLMSITSDQIIGLDRSSFGAEDTVLAYQTTASTAYVDLATVGPQFTEGVGAGVFQIIFGCIYDSTAGGDGYMGFSVNGDTPSDDDSAFAWMSTTGRVNIMRARSVTLTESTNTLVAKYRVLSGTNGFRNRWAVVNRVGNA